MVEIVEIIGRSAQGATRPYICRGDDGDSYIVKGIGAGRKSLVCELIAGRLAEILSLPVASFEIVDVPSDLIQEHGPPASDLGAGKAFASRKQQLNEITYAAVDDVPEKIQRDVFAFDWWIKNGDRNLTESGGNPNLFIRPSDQEIVIIDHNLAFDEDVDTDDFFKYHVFSGAGRDLVSNWELREQYSQKFSETLICLDNIFEEIPACWLYYDADFSEPAEFQAELAQDVLNSCQSEDFWDQ